MHGMGRMFDQRRHCEAATVIPAKAGIQSLDPRLKHSGMTLRVRLLRRCAPRNDGVPAVPGTGSRGFILPLSLVLMIALAAAVGAVIFSLTTDFRNVKVRSESTKAFYLAEAGIADTIKQLKAGELSIADGQSQSFSGTLGEGSYSVEISRSGDEYSVDSTGTVVSQQRTVQTKLQGSGGDEQFPAAFDYAVFQIGTTSSNRNVNFGGQGNVSVSGSIYFNTPDAIDRVTVKPGTQITNGFVYADMVSGSGTYTQATSPASPVPFAPTFDGSSYSDMINVAKREGSERTLGLNGSDVFELQGRTVYYDQLTMHADSQIVGPGTIVLNDRVAIYGNARIGEGVNIVAKDRILVTDSTQVNSGGVLFSQKLITITSNASVTGSVIAYNQSTFSPGRVKLYGGSRVQGAVFSQSVVFSSSAQLFGSAVALTGVLFEDPIRDVRIEYAPGYLPETVPDGLPPREGGGNFTQVSNSWNEA